MSAPATIDLMVHINTVNEHVFISFEREAGGRSMIDWGLRNGNVTGNVTRLCWFSVLLCMAVNKRTERSPEVEMNLTLSKEGTATSHSAVSKGDTLLAVAAT